MADGDVALAGRASAKPSAKASMPQWDLLMDLLNSDKELINMEFVAPNGVIRVKGKWEAMSKLVNLVPGATVSRDGQEWKKSWFELRGRARKRCREMVAYQRGTGGGPPPALAGLPLSDFYKKVINLTGYAAAIGTDCPDPLSIQLNRMKLRDSPGDGPQVSGEGSLALEVAAKEAGMLSSLEVNKEEYPHSVAAVKASPQVPDDLDLSDFETAVKASLEAPDNQYLSDFEAAVKASLDVPDIQNSSNFETAVQASLSDIKDLSDIQAAVEASLEVPQNSSHFEAAVKRSLSDIKELSDIQAAVEASLSKGINSPSNSEDLHWIPFVLPWSIESENTIILSDEEGAANATPSPPMSNLKEEVNVVFSTPVNQDFNDIYSIKQETSQESIASLPETLVPSEDLEGTRSAQRDLHTPSMKRQIVPRGLMQNNYSVKGDINEELCNVVRRNTAMLKEIIKVLPLLQSRKKPWF